MSWRAPNTRVHGRLWTDHPRGAFFIFEAGEASTEGSYPTGALHEQAHLGHSLIVTNAFAAACESADLPTAASPTAVAASVNASSTTVATIPVSFTIQPGAKVLIQNCLGEALSFVGDSRLVAHQTFLPDGSLVLDNLHFNGQGAVALGESTGNTFRVGGADSNPIVRPPAGGLTATFHAQLMVVGTGRARSFKAHILEHITMTPDGDITALVEIATIDCR